MSAILNPYIPFRNNAREAMEFYHGVFGGNLTLSTFGEFNFDGSNNPAEQDLIMHGMLTGENGITLMGADTPSSMEYTAPAGISISLSGDDDAALRGYWEKLTDGGTVVEPLNQAPWGDSFGMCKDKFGISWMVNIAGAGQSPTP
jgi:PhnB protein